MTGYFSYTLGPLAFDPAVQSFTRLADANEGGVRYYRIHAELNPGIGMSARDEVVLWIDPKPMRTVGTTRGWTSIEAGPLRT